jgi:CII-binding regulator of phage lambda lysogenization HflD
MKKILLLVVCFTILLPLISWGEDSKEVLTLQRDLYQEKILRVETQLIVLQYQMREGNDILNNLKKELDSLNNKLKTLNMEQPKK